MVLRVFSISQLDKNVAVQVSIDTACSSALVATNAAAQYLHKKGGTSLSAGVNLMLAERTTAATQVAGVKSVKWPMTLEPENLRNAFERP